MGLAALLAALFATGCSDSSTAGKSNASSGEGSAAERSYVAPGEKDDYYLFYSGGHSGQVFVAGLSNEEFASKLRSVSVPFEVADSGASVEMYHGAHGQWETHSPVRTFVPYEIQAQPHLVAAYTCTPLVTFPVSDLKPGSKVVGKTIAELEERSLRAWIDRPNTRKFPTRPSACGAGSSRRWRTAARTGPRGCRSAP